MQLTFQSRIQSFMSRSSERQIDSPPQLTTHYFQNEPLPDSPPQLTTRSFQNEPLPDMPPQVIAVILNEHGYATPPQRPGCKRGIAALLGDVTNTVLPEEQKRTCSRRLLQGLPNIWIGRLLTLIPARQHQPKLRINRANGTMQHSVRTHNEST